MKTINTTTIMTLVLIIALLPLISLAHAEETRGILPSQGFETVTLLGGQGATFKTSQDTPTDTFVVGVTSIFNVALGANLSFSEYSGSGYWWILLTGTGGRNWIDFDFGLIGPSLQLGLAQPIVNVDIDKDISFGLVIVNTNVTTAISSENPFNYSVNIKGVGAQ